MSNVAPHMLRNASRAKSSQNNMAQIHLPSFSERFRIWKNGQGGERWFQHVQDSNGVCSDYLRET